MSSSTGGRADKLGNRYEGLWVAYSLVRLLAEEVSAVQLEALGDDERGVDLWVTQRDGSRDAQQCKRKNRTAGRWSVGELTRQGVLAALADQLGRHPAARFTFVSAHPAAELRELGDAARAAGGDAEAYFQATLAVDAHANNLRQFCRAVGADHHTAGGRRQAFDLLLRAHTHTFDDSLEGRALVCSLARCHVAGDPRTAVEVLAAFAQDQLGTAVSAEMVRRHLRDRGFGLTRIAAVPNVSARLERLREEFLESLRPGLINAALVPRPEADRVFDLVRGPADAGRLVVLHGRAGDGKSCVLLQLTERLAAAGVPYLPLRLDRRPPRVSAQRYGVDGCGLPESPAVVLRSLYPGRRAVLVVDQLDAVRWTAGHASAQWEACQEVIDEALGFPDLAVVVACRTFDLRDDQQISRWQSRHRGREVEVGELPPEVVAAAVRAAGEDPAGLTERQRALLCSPLHLALWVQVRSGGPPRPGWDSHTDPMREFWRSRFEALADRGVPADEARAAVDALVADMDARGELSAPARLLDRHPRAAAALQSLHVVVRSDRRVTFAHQSHLEYLVAVRLLDQVTVGRQTVVAWVQGGDQTLLRREQLRLVLTLLRDERPADCVAALRQIVVAPPGAIRFHLKQLALRLLGEFREPSAAELDLACELAGSGVWRDHVLDQVVTRQPAWFDGMDDRGLLAAWLASNDDELVSRAIQVCLWWSGRCGDRVAGLLGRYADRPAPWPQRLAAALPFDPAEDSPQLFALRLRLIRAGHCRHRFLLSERLATAHPARCIDLVEAFFDFSAHRPRETDTRLRGERDVPHLVPRHEAEYLERVVAAVPELVWNRLVPRILQACAAGLREERPRDDDPFRDDGAWPEVHRRNSIGHHVELPRIVARAGAILAARDPASFRRDLGRALDHPARTVQSMIGLALAEADAPAADLAVGWLCDDPRRLALRDEPDRRWGIAERIIRRHAGACSEAVYGRLEAAILAYHGPDERDSVRWKAESTRAGWPIRPNAYGLAQHALLPCLPADRASARARSMAGVLERKFGRPASEFHRLRASRVRSLVPPISADRAARISDAGWLAIIRSAARPPGTRPHRDVGDEFYSEPTAEAYSRLLTDQARRQPRRFASLALRIPPDADPQYLAAVLYGVSDQSPPSDDLTDWAPVGDEQVAAVVSHVGYRPDGEIGRALCWMIQRHPGALADARCRAVLCRYATEHPQPAPDDRVVWTGEDNIDYDRAAINCTRGIAVGVLKDLLFEEPSLLAELRPVIGQAAGDPSPIVRVAAAGACLPMLSIDRGEAVALFLGAVSDHDQIRAARNVTEFIRYALGSHFPRLEPLLARMADSDQPATATAGAAWMTVGWLSDRAPRPVIDGYVRGSQPQRLGVARAAAHNCADDRIADRCAALLIELVGDTDPEVQGAVAEFLRDEGVLRLPVMRDVAVRFAAGPGFGAHPTWLVEALRTHPDSLLPLAPVVAAVCARLAADLAPAVRDRGQRTSFELDRFVPLLLRLYEQAEQARDVRLRDECLDWWDRLLEARAGGAVESLVLLDRGAAPGS